MKRIIDALLENGKEFEYETKDNPDITRDTIYIPITREKEIIIEKHKACYMVKVPPKKHFDLPTLYPCKTEEQVIEKLGLNG